MPTDPFFDSICSNPDDNAIPSRSYFSDHQITSYLRNNNHHHISTRMMASRSIPVVAVGVTRHTALQIGSLFEGTAYYIAAVLDFTEAPEHYRFTAENLGTVLYSLHPRPRALVTGTAVEAETVRAIEPVWEDHKERLYREDDEVRSCWVALSKTHGQPGPPPPGIGEEMMRQLDNVFRPRSLDWSAT